MGHIFQLGRKYADALGLQVLDENGKLVTVTMGSYGIGPSRGVAAIAENTLDELGLCWPRAVSPADVHIVAAGKDDAVFAAAAQLADDLSARGLTVMYDDRKASPGVKFKDAEMIGVPTIVTVGRGLADGVFEVRDRASGERTDVAVGEAADHLARARPGLTVACGAQLSPAAGLPPPHSRLRGGGRCAARSRTSLVPRDRRSPDRTDRRRGPVAPCSRR